MHKRDKRRFSSGRNVALFIALLLLLAGAILGYRRWLRGPVPCLETYAKDQFAPEDIQRVIGQGLSRCFSSDPSALEREAAHLPFIMGKDPRNGRSLEVAYHCSDVCPDQGRVSLMYSDVEESRCCALGGYPMHDPAWGGYRGCAPPETPLPPFRWPGEGGKMKLAVRSPCDPTQITVVGDLPTSTE